MADADKFVTHKLDAQGGHDLADDWMLRGCSTVEHRGRRLPSIGKITLLARIGRGGMGVVYRGLNPRLGTEVAVKVLTREPAQGKDGLDECFVPEARLAARLHSEHLVSVIDVDRDKVSKCHFLVMELVRGVTAAQWIDDVVAKARSANSRAAIARVGARECDALAVCIAATKGLAAAHVEGIIHRNVKPGNVLLPSDAQGRPLLARAKLADLGLARGGEGGEAGLSGTQIALATPGYLAPEQAQDARNVAKPADVFAMGAALYALLTGEAPFRGASPVEAMLRTVKGEFQSLRELRPDVSYTTGFVVERCLAHDPSHRFRDAPALLEALDICRANLGARPSEAAEAAARVAALVVVAERGKPVAGAPRSEHDSRPVSSQSRAEPRSAAMRRVQQSAARPHRTTLVASSRRNPAAAVWTAVALAGAAGIAVVAWPSKADKGSSGAREASPLRQRVVRDASTSEKDPPAESVQVDESVPAATPSTPPPK